MAEKRIAPAGEDEAPKPGHENYVPAPLDTRHVALTDEIRELTELLARHTHDIWSLQRIADGWRYGPERNDARKEHPGLIPYEELSESEKEYDRNTSLQTLKAIIALGYTIARKEANGDRKPGR